MLKKLKLKLNNQNNPLLNQQIDKAGLTLIGIISLGYCCFSSGFAKLSIQLPFLIFPIFIGEIFLFICLLLLFFKGKIIGKKPTVWGCVALLYVAFILFKTLSGYLKWGPLALRHSALFYYPLFAVLGYSFFRKEYFTGKKVQFLIALFILILVADTKFLYIVQWDRIACFFLLFVFIRQQPSKKIRYFLFAIFFICAPYRLFFLGQRTLLVSNIMLMIFLLVALPFVVKTKKKVAVGFGLLIFVLFFLGVTKFSDKVSLRSISNLQDNIKEYKEYTAKIAMLEPSFIMQPIKQPRVYNKAVSVIDKRENINLSERALQLQIEQQLADLEHQEAKIKKQFEEQSSEFNKLNKVVSSEKLLKEKIRGQPMVMISQKAESLPEVKIASSQISPPVDVISKSEKPVVAEVKSQLQPIETVSQKAESLPEGKIVSSQINPPIDVISRYAKLALIKREFEKNTVDLLARKKEFIRQQSMLKQQLHQFKGKNFFEQFPPRDLDEVYGNSCFRIFVWQDMIADLKAKKPILGFDFGKPFRSKKIEILGIAYGEWSRDGWIAAHNSYLEIIYRSGIIGIILILLLFVIYIKMVSKAIANKSIPGILLCGILINWFTAANFMLILELPYYAIPLWSLFGMSLAYLNNRNGLHSLKNWYNLWG